MKQLTSLQVLRGIAALGVVLFHIGGPAHPQDLHPFGFGAAGVDIFFVLSGFVMWYATSGRPTDTASFWKARFVRVAPLYYLYTLVFMLLLYVSKGFVVPASEVLKSFLFIPFYSTVNHQPVPILGVGWTLNYEALFYLLFGCSLVLREGKWRLAALVGVLSFLICLRPFTSAENPVALRFTSPMFLEFVMGMVIATQLHRLQRLPGRFGVLLMLASIGLLAGWWLQWPQIPRTAGAGVPAAMLVSAALALEQPWMSKPWLAPLKALGDASYSLYLVHGPVFALVAWYAPPSLHIAAMLPVWVACAVAAGFASYHWVEKPLLAWMRPWGAAVPRASRTAQLRPSAE